MTGEVMTQGDHKLISTPVSVSDGFKRSDGSTWSVLLIVAAVAVAIVIAINVFVEKPPPVQWPKGPGAPAQSSEPTSYDVAPPGAVPPPSTPK